MCKILRTSTRGNKDRTDLVGGLPAGRDVAMRAGSHKDKCVLPEIGELYRADHARSR
jgi:hypothetical protein